MLWCCPLFGLWGIPSSYLLAENMKLLGQRVTLPFIKGGQSKIRGATVYHVTLLPPKLIEWYKRSVPHTSRSRKEQIIWWEWFVFKVGRLSKELWKWKLQKCVSLAKRRWGERCFSEYSPGEGFLQLGISKLIQALNIKLIICVCQLSKQTGNTCLSSSGRYVGGRCGFTYR